MTIEEKYKNLCFSLKTKDINSTSEALLSNIAYELEKINKILFIIAKALIKTDEIN